MRRRYGDQRGCTSRGLYSTGRPAHTALGTVAVLQTTGQGRQAVLGLRWVSGWVGGGGGCDKRRKPAGIDKTCPKRTRRVEGDAHCQVGGLWRMGSIIRHLCHRWRMTRQDQARVGVLVTVCVEGNCAPPVGAQHTQPGCTQGEGEGMRSPGLAKNAEKCGKCGKKCDGKCGFVRMVSILSILSIDTSGQTKKIPLAVCLKQNLRRLRRPQNPLFLRTN